MQLAIKDKGELKRKLVQAADKFTYPCLVDIQEGDLRTHKQNKRYWACVVAGIQAYLKTQGLNHTTESIHEFLKQERFGKKLVQIGDKAQEVSARSSRMSKKQFNAFAEWAEAFALDELNIPPEYFLQEML